MLSAITGELSMRGDYGGALQAATRALSLASSPGADAALTVARFRLGQTLQDLGEFQRAAELMRQNIASDADRPRFVTGLTNPATAIARVWLCFALTQMGEFVEAQRVGHEVIDEMESSNHLYGLVHALWAVGEAQIYLGEWARARTTLERGLAASTAHEFLLLRVSNAAALAVAIAGQGDIARGEELLATTIGEAEQIGILAARNRWLTWLASLRLRKGALDQSREEATRALNDARARRERGTEAWAQRLLGQVAGQPEFYDVAKAERHLFEAQDLAMARGMRPLIAHCHFDLATLYRRSDDSSRTSHHLNVAIAMYREMGMTYWLERAQTEVKGLL